LLILAIAATIGIGTWLTNLSLDHKRQQRFEANLVRITELLALPEELARRREIRCGASFRSSPQQSRAG
jgi:hypothetical protein